MKDRKLRNKVEAVVFTGYALGVVLSVVVKTPLIMLITMATAISIAFDLK